MPSVRSSASTTFSTSSYKQAIGNRKKLEMKAKNKNSKKLKEETDATDFDSDDDKSLRLCTKNVNGQMYLVMAPENETSSLSDVETDTGNSSDAVGEDDSEISVVLLNDAKSNENTVIEDEFMDQTLTVPGSPISTSDPVILPIISPSVLTNPSINSNLTSLLPPDLTANMSVSRDASLNAAVSLPTDSAPVLITNIKKEPGIEPISALAPSLVTKSEPIILMPQAVDTSAGSPAIKSEFVNSENQLKVNPQLHTDGSVDSSGTCEISVPISLPVNHKFTVDNKTTNSAVLPKNIIVRSSQPLSQTNLKNILYSFNAILKATPSSKESSGNVPPKGTNSVLLNGTNTVYSALEPNMSSCISNSTLNVLPPKSISGATSTLANTILKTENQPKISPLPATNLPKKVFVVPVSLPSNNSQVVHLTMVSNSQTTPVPSPVTSFKYMPSASTVGPILKNSQNTTIIGKPTFAIANQVATTTPTSSSAFPLQTNPLGNVLNNTSQMPSQMTPCVLVSTLVDQASPAVTSDDKTIVHNGYVSSNVFQVVKSSNSSISANVPTEGINSKETFIKSSELILPNGVTATPKTPTTNIAILEDLNSHKTIHAITKTTSSYNLDKSICTIPKIGSTADSSCLTKTQQMPGTGTYTSVVGNKTSWLILPASTSDAKNSPAGKTTTIEPNVQAVVSSASPSTTTIINTTKNLQDSFPKSEEIIKNSSSTNFVPQIRYAINVAKSQKLFPRPLAPKTEISTVISPTIINPLSHNLPSTSLNLSSSQNTSNFLVSTSNSSKAKQTSSLSVSPPNSTTSVSYSSNFNKPMVFIGPINPDDLLNLAKHIPSAAQSVFQTSPKTSESVKIIHPSDIYKAKGITNLPKVSPSSSQNIILVPPESLPEQVSFASSVTGKMKSKISNPLILSTSTHQPKNANAAKGISLLNTNAGTQSAPTFLQASNCNNNARFVTKTVHNNIPVMFSPSSTSSSEPLKLNVTTPVGSNPVYSQSQLKPSPAIVSTVTSAISKQQPQQQQQVTSANISPVIKVKQELPDDTVSNVAPVVSLVTSQENITANSLVKLTSFSNSQVNLKLGKVSSTSDTMVKPVSTRVVNYVTSPKSALPQFVKLTKIVDNVRKKLQSPTLVSQPNQSEKLLFKVQQPETQVMQAPDTCDNSKNVNSTTSLTSNFLITSTSSLILPSHLTNIKTSTVSSNNSSTKPESVVISDSQSDLGNLKSICQKEDENPMTLKIDSIFSLRDNSNFTINTPKDDWKIKSEEEMTNDFLKPMVSSLTDIKPVVSSLADIKPVVSSLADIKPMVSSLADIKPMVSSLADIKPVVTSWAISKPVISPSTTSKIVVSPLPTPKPKVNSFIPSKSIVSSTTTIKPNVTSVTTSKPVVLSSLTTSKPMVISLNTSKPVVSSFNTTTPVVTTLTNLQPLASVFPRPQSMVSLIPNSSQPIVSLLPTPQPTLASLRNPKRRISSVTSSVSPIFLSSNLQPTNSAQPLNDVNSTLKPNDINSSQTAFGEISTQTDFVENSTQINYGENSCQTDCEVSSNQTDYGENSSQTDFEAGSSQKELGVNSCQTDNGANSKQAVYKVNLIRPAQEVNLIRPAQEVNLIRPAQEVNLIRPAQEVNSTKSAVEVNSTLPHYVITAKPSIKLNNTLPPYKIIVTKPNVLNSAQQSCKIISSEPATEVNSFHSGHGINSTQTANGANSKSLGISNEEKLPQEASKPKLKFKMYQFDKPVTSKPPVSNSYRQYSYLNPKPIKPKTLIENPNVLKLVKMHSAFSKLQRENKQLEMKINSKKKTRIKIDKYTLSKFPLKQCFVMMPRMYLPDGKKSANVKKLGEKTLKSIKCRATCKNVTQMLRTNNILAAQTASKIGIRYLNTSANTNDARINNSKQNAAENAKSFRLISNSMNPLILPKTNAPLPGQRLLVMQLNGKSVLFPVVNKVQNQQTPILNKGHILQASIPSTLNPVNKSTAIRTSISDRSLLFNTQFVNIAPNVVSNDPRCNTLTNSTSLLNVSKTDSAQSVKPSNSSLDNAEEDDDVNSCLQLACGIIETNTLKRKASDYRRESRKMKDSFQMRSKKSKNYISSMLNI
ncbi:mucin-5AC isoform X3 [Octopus sinensis]|uniref:Mucin-5AC isoform X3 n=1 Tax=Octopus sinensis TaxID=2607531 RepID=A0A7E6ES42_9MOLL|nr:mucin-5AC isoform X3 [Octopus sinensis]